MTDHNHNAEAVSEADTPVGMVCVSNGTEFYEISESDLADALADGFYIPEDRGLFIVSDGQEIFEIQAADLPEATADGFSIVGTEINSAHAAALGIVDSRIATPAEHDDTASESDSETQVPAEPVAAETIHIDATPTEEEIRHQELLDAYKAAEGKEKLWLAWQLYGPTWEGIRQRVSTYGISAVTHLILLLAMGLIVFTVQQEEVPEIVSTIAEVDSLDDALDTNVDVDDLNDSDAENEADAQEEQAAALMAASIPTTPNTLSDLDLPDFEAPQDVGGGPVEGNTQLTGSAKAARGAATAKYGGSPGSEEAVESGLDWLARHQAEDGSWCFNHAASVECDCKNPGSHQGKTGATGLALLCYYGAGYTFAEGDYSATISKGIQYLLKSMEVRGQSVGDLREDSKDNGGIYQHAIATAALCESLSVNLALAEMQLKDRKLKLVDSEGRVLTPTALRSNSQTLRRASELALSYMYQHQSPKTGGWGYTPKSDGDLSVTGWQVMAIASAEHARIPTPQTVRLGVRKYLSASSKDNGATFSYKIGQPSKPSMDAVGLMCSILNGADREGGIATGVGKLYARGPSLTDMYYTYYATQVLFGWGDEPGAEGEKYWTNWNRQLRDPLVARQTKKGHALGSWSFKDGTPGGRHFDTCLAILTLEIYYRKLPMLERLSMDPIDLTEVKSEELQKAEAAAKGQK